MTFTPCVVICAHCGNREDEHCEVCLSCQGEPAKECCMEGWSEEAKTFERAHWARVAKKKAEAAVAQAETGEEQP